MSALLHPPHFAPLCFFLAIRVCVCVCMQRRPTEIYGNRLIRTWRATVFLAHSFSLPVTALVVIYLSLIRVYIYTYVPSTATLVRKTPPGGALAVLHLHAHTYTCTCKEVYNVSSRAVRPLGVWRTGRDVKCVWLKREFAVNFDGERRTDWGRRVRGSWF